MVNARQKTPSAARPFLKWAGGKSQLLTAFERFYPEALKTGRVRMYCEPFVGSGAVLFDLLERYNIGQAVISDQNPDLINAYRVLQRGADDLVRLLTEWQAQYWAWDEDARHQFYYTVRDTFNARQGSAVERAAQLIFLNRTCYNGLYRVNRQGFFNVPMGRYNHPIIAHADNLRRVHTLLQRVTILQGSYQQIAQHADERAFVYLDPPYRPLSKTASFTSYGAQPFTDRDQAELAAFFDGLTHVGAAAMLSNSDPQNTRPGDDFFVKLYAQHHIYTLKALRAINSQKSRRGAVSELIITNYPVAALNQS